MARRVPRPTTVQAIFDELGYVYRAAWHGKLSWDDARSATYVLKEMRATLVENDLDQRLAELDERVTALAAKRNGSGGHPQTGRRL